MTEYNRARSHGRLERQQPAAFAGRDGSGLSPQEPFRFRQSRNPTLMTNISSLDRLSNTTCFIAPFSSISIGERTLCGEAATNGFCTRGAQAVAHRRSIQSVSRKGRAGTGSAARAGPMLIWAFVLPGRCTEVSCGRVCGGMPQNPLRRGFTTALYTEPKLNERFTEPK